VIGIAGGPDKCKWVKSLGADICLDYRSPTFEADLIAATVGFVDVYQDLVGGPILNLMLARMKRGGKIAAVGSISAYNDRSKSVYPNWMEIVSNRISVEGFIVLDFMSEWESATRALGQAVVDGKYSVSGMEEVHKVAFEQVPNVWKGLFTGANKGKLVTEIAI
jgi:NADPH-dependent curcumin reductase CurA